jgi:hypothetical protein
VFFDVLCTLCFGFYTAPFHLLNSICSLLDSAVKEKAPLSVVLLGEGFTEVIQNMNNMMKSLVDTGLKFKEYSTQQTGVLEAIGIFYKLVQTICSSKMKIVQKMISKQR